MGCNTATTCLLLLLVMVCSVHCDMTSDLVEQEEKIKRRCHPQLQSCYPSQLDWARLNEQLYGRLVWPDESFNYTALNYQYNLRTLTYPLVHVVCHSAQDIQNAVRFAKKHNLHVVIKSSGHDYWGRSSAHGSFSINLMEMKHVHVNPSATERSEYGEVTVQTGVNFGELYEKVDKQDRVVVGGAVLKVSPGGYFAGGGIGPFSHSLGLGVDSVLEIKVVLADGSIAVCTHNKTVINNNGTTVTHHTGELFWALRGGGGGTYGVIVHYVLKLHLAPASIVTATFRMPFYQQDNNESVAKAFLKAYDDWVRAAPSHWGGFAYFNNIPTSGVTLNGTYNTTYHHTGTVLAFLNKLGPWDEHTKSELAPLLDLQTHYPEPLGVKIQLANLSSIWDMLENDTLASMYTRGSTAAAIIPPEKHNMSLWNFVVHELMEPSNGEAHCILARLGGKVLDFDLASSSVHSAFRRSMSSMEFVFAAPLDQGIHTYEEQHRQETITANFAAKLRRYGDSDYLNEGFVPSLDWKINFWGAHYVDLLKAKIRYDPDNLFSCYHCVGSDVATWIVHEDTSAGAPTEITHYLFVLLPLLNFVF